jgi:hypothetical protein
MRERQTRQSGQGYSSSRRSLVPATDLALQPNIVPVILSEGACRVERPPRYPSHPAAYKSFQQEKRENSLRRLLHCERTQGPSTPQAGSQTNRPASLRMTEWKFFVAARNLSDPAAKFRSCHLERGRMPESKDPCAFRAALLRTGFSSKGSRENSLGRLLQGEPTQGSSGCAEPSASGWLRCA